MSSTTTNGRGSAARVPDDVADFAAAVRRSLEGLPPDEIEELVDGLEADLIEGREDSGEPLGDAVAYADELRAAAGLPPRDVRPGGEWFGGYKRLWASGSAWVAERRAHPVIVQTIDFFQALRPVWWVLRGWAAFRMTVLFGQLTPVPETSTGWILLAAFVVVSVQWGRGRWLPWAWLLFLKRAVTVVTVIALPFLLAWGTSAVAASTVYAYDTLEVPMQDLSANGEAVTNVFAYDCAGSPLTGVQLFDQDGTPLSVGDGGASGWVIAYGPDGDEVALVPDPAANPGSAWNVFPLQHATFGPGDTEPDPATISRPVAPFAVVPPLSDVDGSCATADGATAALPGSDADSTDPSSTEPSSVEPPSTEGGR